MARERCAAIPRTEALLQEKEDDSVKIPLVLPFHQSSIKITGIIHKYAKILADDDEYGHLFDKNIVTAYKNDKNLKTLLVHKWKNKYRVLAGVNVVFKPNISALSLLQW